MMQVLLRPQDPVTTKFCINIILALFFTRRRCFLFFSFSETYLL